MTEPDNKATSDSTGPQPPKNRKPKNPTTDLREQLRRNWRFSLFYFLTMLLMLWLWQEQWNNLRIRTIPYSEFKQLVKEGKVTECDIRETEILGRAIDSPKPQSEDGSPNHKTGDASDPDKRHVTESGATPPEEQTDQKQSDQKQSDQKQSDQTQSDQKQTDQKQTDQKTFLFRTVRVEDPDLVKELEAANVRFQGTHPGLLSKLLVGWIVPILLMVLLWTFLARRISGAGQGVLSIGKSRAKLVIDEDTGVTFDDVAGCDEAKAELAETVDFLKNPDKYVALGAEIPKGVLLLGPPGTGKTLLARAVAGEAKVPFFSISGSDFVEMFVGVGAARVRDLFDQAEKHAPCIVFIDEIDAIGRQRGVHVGPVNDEREQTLNQLLVEMDGFEPNSGVILLAATNRPEVLDQALLRPGRFDRQIVVDAPDLEGREAILKVHSRNKPLAEDVDLRKIALATPGLSGADLANIMNEAAILAARRTRTVITQSDLEEAVEKVMAGPERKSRRLGEDEKRRVAFHEVGHALVAAFSPHADPVHKISIVPRGRAALGYTLQLPAEQQFLMTRDELFDRIKGLLGGRAAEQIVFGDVSTGAENDLERATAQVRQMVAMYGMGESVGLMHCVHREGQFLANGQFQRDCSEQTAREIDIEVKALLDGAYRDAVELLSHHQRELDAVAADLLQHETIDGRRFQELLRQHASEPSTAK